MKWLQGSCVALTLSWVTLRQLQDSADVQERQESGRSAEPVSPESNDIVSQAGTKDCIASISDTPNPIRNDQSTAVQEWPTVKKIAIAGVICLYTFVVYASSAIYIIGIPDIMLEFNVTEQGALLGLSLFVLAYGFGPLLWAPLSELDFIGRSPVYGLTFIIFLGMSILVSTAKTWTAFLILRFLQGFFGSPCLANGGASMHDLFPDMTLPYYLAVWIAAAYCGPALGPLISGFLVPQKGWRYGMWEIVWMTAPTLVLVLLLPETYDPAIKVRNNRRRSVLSVQNTDATHSTHKSRIRLVSRAIRDAIVKPVQITLQDPAVAVANLYTSFVYGTYYTFFDAFPRVYLFKYYFTFGELGLAFLSIFVACVLGGGLYCCYTKWFHNEKLRQKAVQPHEECLHPALIACVLPPIGLFLFGWTAHRSIHWIVSLLGVTIYATGVYIILQCLSVYLPRIYPRYAASLFAANDLCRSVAAAGLIHAGVPLYGRLGIEKGISVLGAISVLGIPGMWFIYLQGPTLRAKSRFVEK
ncbi:hypothetical protein CKM354_000762600 [Cercospora kikuchii]|uniref:Major facilitator superfamily (MFS) profile domain-containing protein n=1 Tax=Cercospora kikuchii TaxID=84275 RepID=A0A9P3CU74_9PEZI|nr:uncharacterized protein CKM354_000762600 [Cercospora kikuchii]GIZ44428.1 hypothetical protein CKM354_000762600 [Cercospora kikuchii]